uniref:Uncharacterized protein n=1 Tax=Rhizophora mucronata TaxID=61149 RepID=A0A2P2NNK8_RHIMU
MLAFYHKKGQIRYNGIPIKILRSKDLVLLCC